MANNYGLNDSLAYIELELDSRDALSSPFTIQQPPTFSTSVTEVVNTTDWPQFVLSRPLANVAAIKILEVQIPFSYYVISQENSSFTLVELGASCAVVLPSGNYTATTLCTALATALTTASTTYGASKVYTVTYNTTSGRLSVVVTLAGTFQLVFGPDGNTGNTNPRLWLGFNQSQSSTGSFGAFPKTIVAPNCLKITGPDYLYINSSLLGPQTTIYLPGGAANLGSGSIGPQMAKIPVNVQPGGIITWQDPGTCV
jgi:hypothetical protein